jgi:hypothetical protein
MKTVNERIVDAVSILLLTLSLAVSLILLLTLMTYRVGAKTSASFRSRNVVLVDGAWAEGADQKVSAVVVVAARAHLDAA